jgi:oligopeptide transport system ATP-binding protein
MIKKELTKKLFIENEVLETKPILRVQNVNKYFNKNGIFFKALDDISFNVYPGDFFGIIGESGSGKSTIGKSIIRLYNTSGGAISLDDHLINQKNISKKTKS